tara:strand:- start:636 stop:1088 length:453 start_codon:yes stop_codon:yes gene_type:complete
MKYLRIINNEIVYPYNIYDLKNDYKNTSFPDDMNDSVLSEYNIYPVKISISGNDKIKKYSLGTPILSNGEYIEVWNESNLTLSELDVKKASEWGGINNRINLLLRECDWVMLSDSPYKSNLKPWEDYRQALRDVSKQLDPFNIIWPIKPL